MRAPRSTQVERGFSFVGFDAAIGVSDPAAATRLSYIDAMSHFDTPSPRVTGDTEAASPRFRDLETWNRGDLLVALLDGQAVSLAAVRAALPALEAAVEAASARLAASGEARLVYAGAGTSGRLAMLDGVELGPTFGWPFERLAFLLAGGSQSVARAQEGAEDDRAAANRALDDTAVGPTDVVVALAASGRTPFTCEVVAQARRRGALTIAMANNRETPLLAGAEHAILLETGAEVLAGSTRMAAGTAQKIALNLLSTAVMVSLGKVFRGRMVDMRPTNEKLRRRAANMIADVTGCDEATATASLNACGDDIRAAILHVEGASNGASD
jgi:N-acetylmuramic acid 6-phosphate etherase